MTGVAFLVMPECCAVPGCDKPVVPFKHFRTVVGYCLAHGNVLTSFLCQINAPGSGSFDETRHGWENAIRMRAQGIKPLMGPQWRFLWDNRDDLLNAGSAGVDAVIAQGIHPAHLESFRDRAAH